MAHIINAVWWVCLCICLAEFLGCAMAEGSADTPEGDEVDISVAIDEAYATEIAIAEVKKRGWSNVVVHRVSLKQREWYVELYRSPQVIGGDATVVVSAVDGSVVRYHGGR